MLAAAAAWAAEPLQVGEVYRTTIDSTGRVGLAGMLTPSGRIWELHHPDATYLALHFSRFELAPGDQLFVSDPEGRQRQAVSDRGTAEDSTFWSRHVKGNTLILELVSTTLASSAPRSAFLVEEYAAGFVPLGGGTEAICGTDDKENAVCYAPSTEYSRARAVARLLIQGRYLCTGWLVSQDNLLLTNEHCISSSRAALNTDYEFDAEAPECNSSNCQLCYPGDVYDGQLFIRDNPTLDYALIRLAGDPAATYGFLEIDDRDAVVGEQIFMPQHPGGFAKQLGIEDSMELGGVCRVATIAAPACTGATSYDDVGYSCDTAGGSSGSPVIAHSSHKVIALHHCGYLCENTGVPIHLIYDEIAQYLPVPGYCGDGTCLAPETECSCPSDCGAPPIAETSCTDTVDNDCDGLLDCDDPDCGDDPACQADCGASGDPCTVNLDCCSLKCVGKPGRKVCK
jgi:hypothetical protein